MTVRLPASVMDLMFPCEEECKANEGHCNLVRDGGGSNRSKRRERRGERTRDRTLPAEANRRALRGTTLLITKWAASGPALFVSFVSFCSNFLYKQKREHGRRFQTMAAVLVDRGSRAESTMLSKIRAEYAPESFDRRFRYPRRHRGPCDNPSLR